jgi:hypothetical protein
VEQVVQFDARDPAGAFAYRPTHHAGRVATLCEGDKPLCRIERRPTGETSDVWIIAPADPV